VESTVLIVSFIPLFMFAILFGLFMDYEVFLLSRVREEYRRHGDNTRAVIVGIAGTGRDDHRSRADHRGGLLGPRPGR
jgi:RND superfamily putative drug exporter